MSDSEPTGTGGDGDAGADGGDGGAATSADDGPRASGEPALDVDVDLAFEEADLLPAVAQDADSGEVLMLAYVDREALARTRETGYAHYHSRSRDELWKKGGTSGHTQSVREIRVDCDGDALLYRVEQAGGACHTGFASCFYRSLDGEPVGERAFDPDEVYD